MARISSDSTIFNSFRTKNSSSPSIYDNNPFDPSAVGQAGGNLYLQSPSARQSTASFASSTVYQQSIYGSTTTNPCNTPEPSRAKSLASNIVMDKNSKRTRILLAPGSTVTSETGKAAAATSMNDTNVQGTIELPVHEKTVQDVIAGSGVDMPKPSSSTGQAQFESTYPGELSRNGRSTEAFGSRAFSYTAGKPDGRMNFNL